MGKKILEKIFSFPAVVILNTAIIIIVELTGNGKFFFESGAIHAIAIFFVIAASLEVFIRYYIADPISQKFLKFSALALLILAASHVAEFLSYKVFELFEDAVFTNVANFYAASIFLIIIGAEFITDTYQKKSRLITWFSIAGLIALAAIIIALMINDELISLEPSSPTPYFYGLLIISLYIFGLYTMAKVKIVSVLTPFIKYMRIGILLIILATIPNIFYEILEEIGIPEHQIIYLAHFTFFIALSYMFVAFEKLAHLDGLYKEVENLT